MPKYKTQDDIPYIKFMLFSEVIKDKSEDVIFIADKVIEYFYPEVKDNEALFVEEFSIALNKKRKKIFPYLLFLSKLKVADSFIDLDTYGTEKNYKEIFKSILRNWFLFKINPDKVSVQDGSKIMQLFIKELPKSSNLTNIFLIRQLGLVLKR